MALAEPTAGDAVAQSLAVKLKPDQGQAVELLGPDNIFLPAIQDGLRHSGKSILAYIERDGQLKPATRYTVDVLTAAAHNPPIASWRFTTEAVPSVHAINYPLDLQSEPVQWHGQFFSGICNVIFCTQRRTTGRHMS